MKTTYITDIHGEYEGFTHAMRTGSGVLYAQVDEIFGDTLSESERNELATFVAYPENKMQCALNGLSAEEADDFLDQKIDQVKEICLHLSEKYNCRRFAVQQMGYALRQKPRVCLMFFCYLAQKIMIGKLYVLGDIYDRGPDPEYVIDELEAYENAHILWGNHDMTWIGAAAAHPACVATVVRICARYSNLETLTCAYDIKLDKLINFANSAYANDPCAGFALREKPEGATNEQIEELMRVQKAIAIIQFKIEKHFIDENPSFNLSDRALLHRINFKAHTITLDGREYALKDSVFPTVDPHDPYKLTHEEQAIISDLCTQFKESSRLQEHIHSFLRAGSLYAIHDNNLLLHACVPLNADGTLKKVVLYDSEYYGRELFDAMDNYVRDAFFAKSEEERERGRNIIWYLWLGEGSPLFAKSKMATFEMYFVEDKSTHKEVKNAFYSLERSDQLNVIFENFNININKNPHIICGHVPIKVSRGQTPVKCEGRLLMIDGGMSHAYQPTTGIGGFTLESNCNNNSTNSINSTHSVKTYTLNTLYPLPRLLSEIIDNNVRTHSDAHVIENQ